MSGRWHEKGIPILYASSTISLSMLENLVHFQPEAAPEAFALITLEVPDTASRNIIDPNDLPNEWQSHPPLAATQTLGTTWLRSNSALMLLVPSAVLPLVLDAGKTFPRVEDEFNVVINPIHAERHLITVVSAQDFSFDKRLFT